MFRFLALLPLFAVTLASADESMNIRITEKRLVNLDAGYVSAELVAQIADLNLNLQSHKVRPIPSYGEVLQKGRIYTAKDFVTMSFTQAKEIISQDYCAILDGEKFYQRPTRWESFRGKKDVSLSGTFGVRTYYSNPENLGTLATWPSGSSEAIDIIQELGRTYFVYDIATKETLALVKCTTTLKSPTLKDAEKQFNQYMAKGTFGPLLEAFRK